MGNRFGWRALAAASACLVAAACGEQTETSGSKRSSGSAGGQSAALSDGDAGRGSALFHHSPRRCAQCHSLTAEGPRMLGPHLQGVLGRPAGGLEDYIYSPTLQEADLIWSAETIDAWLADPKGYLPGNRMTYPGMPDAADRRDLIAYLVAATNPAAIN